MYTYFLCNDNNTIYRIEFSIKKEKVEKYLSLLENYLNETVFVEESESKKLVSQEEVERENNDSVSVVSGKIMLEKNMVVKTENIEDYLPCVTTIKTTKYFFLRNYTILMLVALLPKSSLNNKYINALFDNELTGWIDFKSIYKFFFNDEGEFLQESYFDYITFKELLEDLDIRKPYKYSYSYLSGYCGIDDADNALAEGINESAESNKKYLEKLSINIFK